MLLSFAICGLTPSGLSAAEQTARLKDGRTVRGQLFGSSAEQLQFRLSPQGPDIPLSRIRSVQFQTRKRPSSTEGPLKRIWLRGGESLSGQIVSWSASTAKICSGPLAQIVEIPTAAIAAVEQPQGTVTLVYDDFEDRRTTWLPDSGERYSNKRSRSGQTSLQLSSGSPPLVYKLADPISAGSAQISFFDSHSRNVASAWNVEFRFETQLGERLLRTVIGADHAVYRMETPLGPRFNRQPLRRSGGWRRLEVQFDALSTLLSIDGNLLASGPAMKGVLKSVRWSSSPAKGSAARTGEKPAAAMWIDDFQITQHVAAQPLRLPRRTQDVLLLATGDEIYGSLRALDREQVELRGKFGSVTVPWRELRGVLQRERAVAYPAVSGVAARIFLHDSSPASSLPHRLYAAVDAVGETEMTILHPVFGRCTLPLSLLLKIEPLFEGKHRLLFPGSTHLGDEIRRDFGRREPDGREWELTFQLDAPPAGGAYVSLLAAHLEPSGPRTAASPFLSELRRGYLGTFLVVNGQRIGRLNDQITFRAAVDKPERIRTPIPPGLLKAGENRLRLEQESAEKDAPDFDDCEISRISLEIEESKGEQ